MSFEHWWYLIIYETNQNRNLRKFLSVNDVTLCHNVGSINLHRGDLPKYAGVEPIKRALQNSEKFIHVSCHHISKNFDEGKVIFKSIHPTNYDISKSIDDNVERLKIEITPYFPQLTIKSLELLIDSKYDWK